MTRTRLWTLSGAACTVFALASPMPAVAGPCTEQINEVSRALSNDPSLGGVTSGALSGTAPGAIQSKAPMPETAAGATGGTGKEQGTLAGAAPGQAPRAVDPAPQIATSPQDVRLQQAGQPTVAQGGNPATVDRMSQAKMQLEKARTLDAQNNPECSGALQEARNLMGGQGSTATR